MTDTKALRELAEKTWDLRSRLAIGVDGAREVENEYAERLARLGLSLADNLQEQNCALLDELESLRDAARWRRFGDEKPPEDCGDELLVFIADSGGIKVYDLAFWDGDEMWSFAVSINRPCRPDDLWMPLPSPPKGEG